MQFIETLNPRNREKPLRCAVLDFDGTISLIREGWQQIMIPFFTLTLLDTPLGKQDDPKKIEELAREFIFLNTGKQTIYQCIALAEEVRRLQGVPLDPQEYKDEYHKRLLKHIDNRIQGLRDRSLSPDDLMVPGARMLLDLLREHDMTLYLASGTDLEYVLEEAQLLGVSHFFTGGIYGAMREYKLFSKAMIIEKILTDHQLYGSELIGFGDGYVEIENTKAVGGYAVGVASNEQERTGIDLWKRNRLISAGADMIIPDYRDIKALEAHLLA